LFGNFPSECSLSSTMPIPTGSIEVANMIQEINLFRFFFWNLKKIHYFGGPKHNLLLALLGLDRKKPDKFKNNEEKASLKFWYEFIEHSYFVSFKNLL
jgi:hypothetical protein